MIQKIKDKLTTLDRNSIGTFLFFLGNFIVVSGLSICVAIIHGAIAGAVSFGIGLMAIGFLLAL